MDNDYEIILHEKEWFNLEYTDYSKIKSYTNAGLKGLIDDNKKMEIFCTPKHFSHVMSKKDFFDSKNTKELCRHGIPYFYIKDFILKMFSAQNELEDSFKLKFKKVFKERDRTKLGDYVPYLTGFPTLEESLPVHFLNEKGIQSLKEVQWMLNSVIPTIEFTPILLKLNMILHLFCEQHQVYFILRNLINLNYSLKETYKIRWHMRFNYEDNTKVISSIIESLKELSGKSGKCTMEHLDTIGITSYAVVEDIVFNFFLGYIPFEAIIRLVPFFLREGTKAIYRMVYALFKTIQTKVFEIKNANEAISLIKKASFEINDYNKLFETALSYNLTRNNNKYDFQPIPEGDQFSNRRSAYYLPNLILLNEKLENADRVLNEEFFIKLWSELPCNLKIKDCEMIFSASVNGFSLKTLYQVGEDLMNTRFSNPYDYTSIIIIETTKGEVFGALFERVIGKTNKPERPQYSFVFQLKPKYKIYQQIEFEYDIISGENDCFLFGFSINGCIIRLDESLSHGYSNPSTDYASPKLTVDESGEYNIKNIEVYNLV